MSLMCFLLRKGMSGSRSDITKEEKDFLAIRLSSVTVHKPMKEKHFV
jgi:hypothetical protein